MRLHAGQHFFQAKRFGNIVHAADLKPLYHIFCSRFGGDKYDWNIPSRLIVLQPSADFDSIHLRHHDIQQNQVGLYLGDQL